MEVMTLSEISHLVPPRQSARLDAGQYSVFLHKGMPGVTKKGETSHKADLAKRSLPPPGLQPLVKLPHAIWIFDVTPHEADKMIVLRGWHLFASQL